MSWRAGVLIGLVLLLAAWLRVREAAARTSMHGDEVQTVEIARAADDIPALMTSLLGEGHPPLIYLHDYAALRLGLRSDPQLRALRVIAGVLAVCLLMFLLARWFGSPAAIAGGLVMAASPFFIQQSADLRSYSLFVLLSLAHFGCVVLHGERRRAWTAILWGVSAGLLCSLHYYAIHQVVAAGVFLLLQDRTRAGVARVVLAALCCIAVFAPWLEVFGSAAGTGSTTNWYVHRIGWSQLWLFAEAVVGSGVAVLVLFWAFSSGWLRAANHSLAVHAAVATVLGSALLAWLLHLYHGPYLGRYLCGTAAVALVPLGFALGRLFDQPRSAAIGAGLIALILVSQQLDAERWQKPPSNAAPIAAIIERRFRPGDVVWAHPEFDAVILRYHLDAKIPIHVPGLGASPRWVDVAERWERQQDPGQMDREVRAARAILESGGRVWFVSQFLGEWAAEHRLDRGYGVPHESALSRPEVRGAMRVWRTLWNHGRVEHILGGGDRGLRISIALMLVSPAEEAK